MRSVTHFLRYSSLKCSKLLQFARRSWTPFLVCLPLRGDRENCKKLFLSCGRFHSLLMAFRNSKTRRHSQIKQTRPSTKQDFSGEALSKQNTEVWLASLSWNSSQAPTEWSAIFAYGVLCTLKKVLRQPHNVLTLQISLSLRTLGGFSFHWSYKHTIYCATKLVSPYVFFFVFRIARSRTVWVTVIFKARFQPRGDSCFFSSVGDLA